MRRRLLFSTLAVAVTAVVLFGLPLAFVLMRLQTNAAHQLVQRDATTVARTLQNRLRSGLPPDPTDAADAAHSLPDRYVTISRDGGPPVTFGEPLNGDAITARSVTKNFKVTVVADDSVATEGITEALAITGSLALLAVAVAVALAKEPRQFWFHLAEIEVGPQDARKRIVAVENIATGERQAVQHGGLRLRIEPERDPALILRCLVQP